MSSPFGFMLLWFDIGLLLMLLGEYWFTIRKGHSLNITTKYVLKFFGLCILGPIIINRIVTELFEEYPEFLTPIFYIEKELAIVIKEEITKEIDSEIINSIISISNPDKTIEL